MHDFTSTPTNTINGVLHTAVNTANASTFDLDAATGLRIFPTNAGDLNGATHTASSVSFLLDDTMASFDLTSDTIVVQVHMTLAALPAAQWDSGGVWIGNSTTPVLNNIFTCTYAWDGTQRSTVFKQNATSDVPGAVQNPTMFEFQLFGTQIRGFSAASARIR